MCSFSRRTVLALAAGQPVFASPLRVLPGILLHTVALAHALPILHFFVAHARFECFASFVAGLFARFLLLFALLRIVSARCGSSLFVVRRLSLG